MTLHLMASIDDVPPGMIWELVRSRVAQRATIIGNCRGEYRRYRRRWCALLVTNSIKEIQQTHVQQMFLTVMNRRSYRNDNHGEEDPQVERWMTQIQPPGPPLLQFINQGIAEFIRWCGPFDDIP